MAQQSLQVFDFEGQPTRVVIKDGAPWWVGKDVCDILGYANSLDAIEKHCKRKETFGVAIRDTGKGSVQQMLIIPESDVYRLIIRSNLPEVEKFERWVMEKVLPLSVSMARTQRRGRLMKRQLILTYSCHSFSR